jgi:hypothetical protein
MLRDFAVGCTGHFLIAMAAVIFFGGAAHYFGLSGRIVFAIIVVTIFVVSVLIPAKKKQ